MLENFNALKNDRLVGTTFGRQASIDVPSGYIVDILAY